MKCVIVLVLLTLSVLLLAQDLVLESFILDQMETLPLKNLQTNGEDLLNRLDNLLLQASSEVVLSNQELAKVLTNLRELQIEANGLKLSLEYAEKQLNNSVKLTDLYDKLAQTLANRGEIAWIVAGGIAILAGIGWGIAILK